MLGFNICLLYILARCQGTARLMSNSFGSSLWMMPFSKYCRADGMYLKHFSGGIRKDHHTYKCEQEEFQSNYSGWPTNLINIEIPSIRGKALESVVLLFIYLFIYFGDM